jgi:hypothetical protein
LPTQQVEAIADQKNDTHNGDEPKWTLTADEFGGVDQAKLLRKMDLRLILMPTGGLTLQQIGLPRTMAVWGVVMTATSLVQNYHGLQSHTSSGAVLQPVSIPVLRSLRGCGTCI